MPDAAQPRPLLPRGGQRAIVLLPPDEVTALADSFRRRFDAEWFERVPPHVSLLGPFLPAEPDVDPALDPDREIARRLGAALAGTGPFEITFCGPDVFIVPELVLFLRVEDEAPLRGLHERVAAALPAHAPKFPFQPHLTLGRFASQEALSRAIEQAKADTRGRLPPWRVEDVHIYGENPETGVYRSVADVPLGQEPISAGRQ